MLVDTRLNIDTGTLSCEIIRRGKGRWSTCAEISRHFVLPLRHRNPGTFF
jgi:hypothetical protein